MGSTVSCPIVAAQDELEEECDQVLLLDTILQLSNTDDDDSISRQQLESPRKSVFRQNHAITKQDAVSIVCFDNEDGEEHANNGFGCFSLSVLDCVSSRIAPHPNNVLLLANELELPEDEDLFARSGELELHVSREASNEDEDEDPDADLDSLRFELQEAEASYRKREATTLLANQYSSSSSSSNSNINDDDENGNNSVTMTLDETSKLTSASSSSSSFIDLQQLFFSGKTNGNDDDKDNDDDNDTKTSSKSSASLLLFTSTDQCSVVDIYETRTTMLKPQSEQERRSVPLERSGIPFRKCRDPSCSCHRPIRCTTNNNRQHQNGSPKDSPETSSFRARRLARRRAVQQQQQQKRVEIEDDETTLTTADFSNSTRSANSWYNNNNNSHNSHNNINYGQEKHRTRSEDYVETAGLQRIVVPVVPPRQPFGSSGHSRNQTYPQRNRSRVHSSSVEAEDETPRRLRSENFGDRSVNNNNYYNNNDCKREEVPSTPQRRRSFSTTSTPTGSKLVDDQSYLLSPTGVVEEAVRNPLSSSRHPKNEKTQKTRPPRCMDEREHALADCRKEVRWLQKIEKAERREEYEELLMSLNPNKLFQLQRRNRFHRAMQLSRLYYKMGLLHYQQGRYDTGRGVLDEGLEVLISDRASAAAAFTNTTGISDSFDADYNVASSYELLPQLPTLDEVAPHFSHQALVLAAELILAKGKMFAAQGLWHRAKRSSGTVLQWSSFQKQRILRTPPPHQQSLQHYPDFNNHCLSEYWRDWGPITSRALVVFGESFEREQRPDIAMRYYQEALAVQEHDSSTVHLHTAETLYKIGNLHASQGTHRLAEDCYKKSLGVYQFHRHHQNNNACLLADEATVLAGLGWIYLLQEDTTTARLTTIRALESTVRALGHSHKNVASLNYQLECIQNLAKRRNESSSSSTGRQLL